MNYFVILKVEDDRVYVLGIFHELEQYKDKLQKGGINCSTKRL